MTLAWLAGTALLLTAVPAVLCIVNLFLFRVPKPGPIGAARPVSVLIPARNEEARIGRTLDAVLADPNPRLEVVVMDDHSEDGTGAIVRARADRDARVRLETAPPLAPGWNGKQHACNALARTATHAVLVFLDADVELEVDALQRICGALESSNAALLSGFPRQITVTFLERLLIPLVPFVLLGFLPIPLMRRSKNPAFGAGCGQLMVVRREAYIASGGHAAISDSRHDGVKLPRAFRRAGLATDLFDATPLAACRMYQDGREVWSGLAKNATEGLATPRAILPWTVILAGGQALPFVLFAITILTGTWTLEALLAGVAAGLAWLTRGVLALRFAGPFDSVLLHPLGVLVLLAIQYQALARRALGRPVAWRGRCTT